MGGVRKPTVLRLCFKKLRHLGLTSSEAVVHKTVLFKKDQNTLNCFSTENPTDLNQIPALKWSVLRCFEKASAPGCSAGGRGVPKLCARSSPARTSAWVQKRTGSKGNVRRELT